MSVATPASNLPNWTQGLNVPTPPIQQQLATVAIKIDSDVQEDTSGIVRSTINDSNMSDSACKKRGRGVCSPKHMQEQETAPPDEHQLLSPPRCKQNSGARTSHNAVQFGCSINFSEQNLRTYLATFTQENIVSIHFTSDLVEPKIQHATCTFASPIKATVASDLLHGGDMVELLPPLTFHPAPEPFDLENIADKLCTLSPDGMPFIMPLSCMVEQCSHSTGRTTKTLASQVEAISHYWHFHPDLIEVVMGKTATWQNYLGWSWCPNNRCEQLFFDADALQQHKAACPQVRTGAAEHRSLQPMATELDTAASLENNQRTLPGNGIHKNPVVTQEQNMTAPFDNANTDSLHDVMHSDVTPVDPMCALCLLPADLHDRFRAMLAKSPSMTKIETVSLAMTWRKGGDLLLAHFL